MELIDTPANGQKPRRFIPLLRVVHPAPPPKPRKHRVPPPVFSAEEEKLIRTSLKTAKGLFGSWACLADAMHMSDVQIGNVAHGKVTVSGDLAVRLAKALGVPLEVLFRPSLRVVRRPCPTCGGSGET